MGNTQGQIVPVNRPGERATRQQRYLQCERRLKARPEVKHGNFLCANVQRPRRHSHSDTSMYEYLQKQNAFRPRRCSDVAAPYDESQRTSVFVDHEPTVTVIELQNVIRERWARRHKIGSATNRVPWPKDRVTYILERRMLLGNQSYANEIACLKRDGVTHVLNCAYTKDRNNNRVLASTNRPVYTLGGELPPIQLSSGEYKRAGLRFKGVPIQDTSRYCISQHFSTCFDFIDGALKKTNGKVLIHCMEGMSRSPVIVMAYLMARKGYTALEAVQLVADRRVILPNDGFLQELCMLDQHLNSV